jgi:Rv0078B-related antitoxin
VEDPATAAERLRTAFALFEAGVEMMRQNLRREFPNADESEIQERLTAWLRHRPGAEYGDCDGRPVDPAKRFS